MIDRNYSDLPVSKETYVPKLLELFRQFGYEGVTLSQISRATGLGKASLYHHFPGGKAEMAQTALMATEAWLETAILPILARATPAAGGEKIEAIAAFEAIGEEIDNFFAAGENACLWAVLAMEKSSHALFGQEIDRIFSRWLEAIAQVLVAAGVEETRARERSEDAAIAIQGALILSRSLNNCEIFQRTIQQLPQQLCQDINTLYLQNQTP